MSEEASPQLHRTQYGVHFHKTKVRNLVDPASGRMLVSKIKPCKSKFLPLTGAKLQMAH